MIKKRNVFEKMILDGERQGCERDVSGQVRGGGQNVFDMPRVQRANSGVIINMEIVVVTYEIIF